MIPRRRLVALLVLLASVVACDEDRLRPDGPAAPDPPPAPLRIDYRVNGTIRGVDITYSNAAQGTTFVVADLPWFATFDTMRPRTFVALTAAAPFSNPTEGALVAQIFVNGELFREATARGFVPSVTISGEVTR